MGDRVGAPHRTHLYQMAQRAGMGTRAVAATHWGFAAFHAALALVFLRLPPNWKPLIVLPALAVQLVWLAVVALRVRRAGLSWRGWASETSTVSIGTPPGPIHCRACSTAPPSAATQNWLVKRPSPAARQVSSTSSTAASSVGFACSRHSTWTPKRMPSADAVGPHQVDHAAGQRRAFQQRRRRRQRVGPVEAGRRQHLAEAGGRHHAAAIGLHHLVAGGAPEPALAHLLHQGGMAGAAAERQPQGGAGGLDILARRAAARGQHPRPQRVAAAAEAEGKQEGDSAHSGSIAKRPARKSRAKSLLEKRNRARLGGPPLRHRLLRCLKAAAPRRAQAADHVRRRMSCPS